MTRHVLSHAFFDNYQRAPSHPEFLAMSFKSARIALGLQQSQSHLLSLMIAANRVGKTGFNCTKDSDETFFDFVSRARSMVCFFGSA
jgi:hypothetical protein